VGGEEDVRTQAKKVFFSGSRLPHGISWEREDKSPVKVLGDKSALLRGKGGGESLILRKGRRNGVGKIGGLLCKFGEKMRHIETFPRVYGAMEASGEEYRRKKSLVTKGVQLMGWGYCAVKTSKVRRMGGAV